VSALLTGRRCVVTGAARGIGRAIRDRFSEEGATVIACDIVADDGIVACDVSDRDAVESLAREAGSVDVLVANAGILLQDHVLDMDVATWQRTLDVNLTGVFHCVQAFGRKMVERGEGGRILITSSIGGKHGGRFYGAYAASKFGVIGLAESAAAELAEHGILVNCVCPGTVDTDMMVKLTNEQADATGRSAADVYTDTVDAIAMGRYADPREIADAFVFLASPLSRYVTGQSIVVDGGMMVV
jgi:NAD(P)-dependent dehydrogenase (short-subunit alcohol dehydrogenase family)